MYFLLEDKYGKQFTFYHIPKTGGSSIRGLKNKSDGYFKLIKKSNNFLESTFSFTIIRNPYERLISMYSDFSDNRGILKNWDELINIMKTENPTPLQDTKTWENVNKHVKTYSPIIESNNFDYVLNYANYTEDLLRMCNNEGIHIDIDEFPRKNVSFSKTHKIPDMYTDYVTDYLLNDVEYYNKISNKNIYPSEYFGEINFEIRRTIEQRNNSILYPVNTVRFPKTD
jgi:hypothetical protein